MVYTLTHTSLTLYPGHASVGAQVFIFSMIELSQIIMHLKVDYVHEKSMHIYFFSIFVVFFYSLYAKLKTKIIFFRKIYAYFFMDVVYL